MRSSNLKVFWLSEVPATGIVIRVSRRRGLPPLASSASALRRFSSCFSVSGLNSMPSNSLKTARTSV